MLLVDAPPEPKISEPPEKTEDRAKRIKAFIIRSGGETTWPKVREFLGLPLSSTPGPLLVRELKDEGVESVKNPKTSTKIWRLKTNSSESTEASRHDQPSIIKWTQQKQLNRT